MESSKNQRTLENSTRAVHEGFNAKEHLQAVKMPIYQTSSFLFETAEQGGAFFQHKMNPELGENGYIYSRLDSPNLSAVEKRLCIWDGAEASAVFESGMAAITATVMTFCKPGDVILHTEPLYGGTDVLLKKFLAKWQVSLEPIFADETQEEILKRLEQNETSARVSMIYIETPANPTSTLFDLEMLKNLSDALPQKPITLADNTYAGPLYQQPLRQGIDLVMYSATKYLGGHSDLIAGATLGKAQHIQQIKSTRNTMGNMAGPHTAWLLLRSLETLELRMERAQNNAEEVIRFLESRKEIAEVWYPGASILGEKQNAIFLNQMLGHGAMVSFVLHGGYSAAMQFLNALQTICLGVSLGSTESLAQHPFTMTHSNVDEAVRLQFGITPGLIRLSVGIEAPEDLIADLEKALVSIDNG